MHNELNKCPGKLPLNIRSEYLRLLSEQTNAQQMLQHILFSPTCFSRFCDHRQAAGTRTLTKYRQTAKLRK